MDSFISTPNEIAVVQKIERSIRKMKPIPIFDISERKEEKNISVPFEFEEKETEVQEEFSIPY